MKIPYTNIRIGKDSGNDNSQPDPFNVTRKKPGRVDIDSKLRKIAYKQTRKDIQNWNHAVDRAKSYNNPSRTQLMDVYRDISIDGHLTGIVTSIKRKIKSKEYQLVNSDNEVQEELVKNFHKKWFDDRFHKASV